VRLLVVPKEVEQKEREIKQDLMKLGIRVDFKINRVDSETRAWEHTIGFYKVLPREQSDKLWEIVRKHYNEWYQTVVLGNIKLG
jgi:hypothetical protein